MSPSQSSVGGASSPPCSDYECPIGMWTHRESVDRSANQGHPPKHEVEGHPRLKDSIQDASYCENLSERNAEFQPEFESQRDPGSQLEFESDSDSASETIKSSASVITLHSGGLSGSPLSAAVDMCETSSCIVSIVSPISQPSDRVGRCVVSGEFAMAVQDYSGGDSDDSYNSLSSSECSPLYSTMNPFDIKQSRSSSHPHQSHHGEECAMNHEEASETEIGNLDMQQTQTAEDLWLDETTNVHLALESQCTSQPETVAPGIDEKGKSSAGILLDSKMVERSQIHLWELQQQYTTTVDVADGVHGNLLPSEDATNGMVATDGKDSAVKNSTKQSGSQTISVANDAEIDSLELPLLRYFIEEHSPSSMNIWDSDAAEIADYGSDDTAVRLAEAKAQVESLEERNQELRNEKLASDVKLKELDEAISALRIEKADQSSQITSLRKEILSCSKEITKSRKRIEVLEQMENQYHESNDKCTLLQESLRTVTAQLTTQEEENRYLRIRMDNYNAKHEKEKSHYNYRIGELEKLLEKYESAEQENAKAKFSAAELTAENVCSTIRNEYETKMIVYRCKLAEQLMLNKKLRQTHLAEITSLQNRLKAAQEAYAKVVTFLNIE